ncbi:MAG: hypothetical protein ACI9JR_002161, partial [Gammaproteobacteria bacterium]
MICILTYCESSLVSTHKGINLDHGFYLVIPASVDVDGFVLLSFWIPAFAGMPAKKLKAKTQ